MPSMRLKPPEDYVLSRDVCSYGYFLLSPNRWDVRDQALRRTLVLPDGPAAARISQPGGPGSTLRIAVNRTLSPADRAALQRQVTRMLRLDESAEEIAAFHRLDGRWKNSGRGRLFRSPTLFEDILKTVTSCNVTWPSTVHMNRRLCDVLGEDGGEDARSFPSAAKVARVRVQTLRARCRVGYRDARIIELARLCTTPPSRGGLDLERLEDPATPDEVVHETLLDLPGIGPYAAANIMQLLGRYSRLPLDTESVRHGRTVLGFDGSSSQVMKKVRAHFEPFGMQAFRSYWFEMWEFYESRHGPAHTWERDSTGKMFTAALLNK